MRRITYSLRSKASWSRLLRPGARADEQLADHRPAGAGDLAGLGRVDRHVAPAEQSLTLCSAPCARAAARGVARGAILRRQEAHQHAVVAGRRQLEARRLARTARRGICIRIPAPSPVFGSAPAAPRCSRFSSAVIARETTSWVGRLSNRGDHPHAAGVVLEARVVETDGLWRLCAVRWHGSAPLGWSRSPVARAGGHLRRSEKAYQRTGAANQPLGDWKGARGRAAARRIAGPSGSLAKSVSASLHEHSPPRPGQVRHRARCGARADREGPRRGPQPCAPASSLFQRRRSAARVARRRPAPRAAPGTSARSPPPWAPSRRTASA